MVCICVLLLARDVGNGCLGGSPCVDVADFGYKAFGTDISRTGFVVATAFTAVVTLVVRVCHPHRGTCVITLVVGA
jgi:hypothetical protein